MKRILFLLVVASSLLTSCIQSKEKLDIDAESVETVPLELIEKNPNQEKKEETFKATEEFSEYSNYQPTMVFVEGGTFQLGSEQSGFHDVRLSSFEIGETEVTLEQYNSAIGETEFNKERGKYPKSGVNWYEAVIYCNILSMQYGYEPCYTLNGEQNPSSWDAPVPYFTESDGDVGDMTLWNSVECNFNANGYRLPTLAEWTFSALGGNKSNNTKYSGSNNINEVGWTKENAEKSFHEVAMKKPNELGIYDMSGNVWEWCWDRRGAYSTESEYNPTGPTEGSWYRVIRGGGWGTPASYSAVNYSAGDSPNVQSVYYGFRLCRSIGDRTEVQAEKSSENPFTHCYFNSNTDQIILSNETGNYKLTVWLYGTPIEEGEYQVFGSDKETLLEGFLEEGNDSRDVKTTLFISYSEGVIKVSGSAQLYKPHSATKSGEILDFNYEGSLVKLQ